MNYHFPLVLFDSECPMCLRFKQGLEYLDKNLCFISARDEEIYRVFPELSRQECLKKVHLITEEKQVLVGPDVVDYLAKRLPGVSKLAWLLDTDQGQKVKDFFYNKVEELRQLTLKKEDECKQCPNED